MPETPHRSRVGRPYRRLRRWFRHTPGNEIAQTLIALGATLIVAAAILMVTIV